MRLHWFYSAVIIAMAPLASAQESSVGGEYNCEASPQCDGPDWYVMMPTRRMKDVVTVYDQIRTSQDIAPSVNVIDQDALDKAALVHPAEVLNRVAGVNVHRGSGQEHLTAIRSPVLTGGAGAGSFLYLQDGISLRAAGFANVNGLFEAGTEFADQVEVFKGPGPAQYGSNAVHGLINVVSKDVGDKNRVTAIGSSRGYGRLTAAANVSESLRASLSLAHDDGFRDDSGFDQQKAQLRYKADVGAWDVDWISSFTNLNQETAGFLQGDDAYRDEDAYRTNRNPEAFRDGKTYRTQASFSRDTNGHKLVLTPYARRAELRFLRHFVPGQALEKNGHSSVGLQSKLIGDDWSVGTDLEYTKGSLYEFQDNPSRFSFVQGLHFDYDVTALVGAAYATKEWALTPRLRLDMGARAEYTHYDYDNKASDGRSGRFIRSADRSDDFLTVTPKIGLVYGGDDITLFARAARGSRAPQTTDLYSAQLKQVPGEAKVETLDSLEGGFRFGNKFSVTAYTMWKDNFFFRNADGSNVTNGKTRHTGVELSFQRDLTDHIYLSGEGSLAKHSYAFNLDEGSTANNILKSNRVDTAPDTMATFRLGARPMESLSAEVEWRHMGSYFTNPGNTARYPGHDIFVLRGNYDVTEEIRLFGRVDNVLDTRYADRADFAFGNERYFPGRPRTVFLGLSTGF